MKNFLKAAVFLSAASIFGALTASTALASDGRFTDVEAQPSALNERFLRHGHFIPPRNITRLESGIGQLTKEEVANLLGQPNDPSSRFDDEYWLYNINLPLQGDDHLVCQYRVTFSQQRVASTNWRRPQCQARYQELSGPQELTLAADLLFAFNSSNISVEGQRTIQAISSEILNNFDRPTIRITGHADRIGSAAYNQRLSEQRARAVASALASNGVSQQWITYEGRGFNDPVVYCDGSAVTEALKSCLAPNRRVNILLHERL